MEAKDAQKELARRALARKRLVDFCAYVDPEAAKPNAADPFVENQYRWPHLGLAARYVEKAEAGTLWDGMAGDGMRVLIITMPPGHWKTSLLSRKNPAWFIGKRKAAGLPHQVISTSYNASLAQTNNRAVLELMRDNPRYKTLFPMIQLSANSQSSEEFSLAGEPFPCSVAAGVGGGLTGHHGDMALVDDPIKDWSQANSPTYINNLVDWWQSVLYTRVNKGGFVLGYWTRWSEKDPVGQLLRLKKAGQLEDRLVVVRIPALAETDAERESAASMGLPVDPADLLGREPGEAICPDIATAEELKAFRRQYPVTFEALHQGRPRPAGGYIAGREAFKVLPTMPTKDVAWLFATDWAITEKQTAPKKSNDPDFTTVGLVGLWTPNGNKEDARLVIADIKRGQTKLHGGKALVKGFILGHGDKSKRVFAGQAHIDDIAFDDLRRDAALLAYRFITLGRDKMSGDKVTNAKTWLEDRLMAGQVYVVAGEWNEDFFNEVEAFPHGAHDDMVDMVSVGVHGLGMGKRDRAIKTSQTVKFYA